MNQMKDLKRRAVLWPNLYGLAARELIKDAHRDLASCQTRHAPSVIADLRKALLALEKEMNEGRKSVKLLDLYCGGGGSLALKRRLKW